MSADTKYPLNWELESLLPNPATDEFQQIFAKLRNDLHGLAGRAEQLPELEAGSDSAETWADFLSDYAAALAALSDVHAHIGCHAAADAENETYQHREAELASLRPVHQQIDTAVQFALRNASDETFDAFVSANPQLEEIRFYLTQSRKAARLRLPKDQELLAADLDVDGLHAWGRLYDRLSGKLRVKVMERGEVVEKSPGQVQFDSPERTVRQNNFYASSKAWQSIADTCADAVNHIAGSRLTRYRRLDIDHLAVPLHLNCMQAETLEAMWSVISERKSVLVDYLQAKAKLLGLESLCWYDQVAPVGVGPSTGRMDWDEACDTVIETFHEFSNDLGEFGSRALSNGWIEAEDRSGKRQGGFCTGYPTKQQSRIFMTFTQSADSMSTLAHELGHAYHSHVLREQPLLLQDYPMNLAETASTFAEAIVADRRLADAQTSQERLRILDSLLSDGVAFLMNIHCRFLFEDRFHKERAEGELSASRLSELMLAAQQEAYCNALDDDGWYPGFWISKLHFYITGWPFYNFPYTFGYLLSQGLYQRAAEDPNGFPEQYRDFLIATGCRTAEDAVADALGADLTKPDFWHACIDPIDERVKQFVSEASRQ